jgi:hypothetical protein
MLYFDFKKIGHHKPPQNWIEKSALEVETAISYVT